MSQTLNFVDHLLSRGRNYHEIGLDRDALACLSRLAGFPGVPAEVNEEAVVRIAEIYLAEGRFTKARRHLTALLVQRPDSARYHYLMATAYDQDEHADPQRAAEHYRKSLEHDRQQPECLGKFGLLALRLGNTEEGIGCLREAVEQAPHDVKVLGRLVEGLRQEGRDDEARATLLAGRFRNPRAAHFIELWNDFQFQILHADRRRRAAQAHIQANTRRPNVLPFVRVLRNEAGKEQVVRLDPPALPQPPHAPQNSGVPGKKHA